MFSNSKQKNENKKYVPKRAWLANSVCYVLLLKFYIFTSYFGFGFIKDKWVLSFEYDRFPVVQLFFNLYKVKTIYNNVQSDHICRKKSWHQSTKHYSIMSNKDCSTKFMSPWRDGEGLSHHVQMQRWLLAWMNSQGQIESRDLGWMQSLPWHILQSPVFAVAKCLRRDPSLALPLRRRWWTNLLLIVDISVEYCIRLREGLKKKNLFTQLWKKTFFWRVIFDMWFEDLRIMAKYLDF